MIKKLKQTHERKKANSSGESGARVRSRNMSRVYTEEKIAEIANQFKVINDTRTASMLMIYYS